MVNWTFGAHFSFWIVVPLALARITYLMRRSRYEKIE